MLAMNPGSINLLAFVPGEHVVELGARAGGDDSGAA